MKEYIKKEIAGNIDVIKSILDDDVLVDELEKVGRVCIEAYRNRRKILICGNGGSAGDAMHFVGELVGRYRFDRRGVEAICLNANEINLTAIGNDYGYDAVFSRQVTACADSGDVLIGISTSGNSKNINNAFAEAKAMGVTTVGLLGRDGGEAAGLCDYKLVVAADVTSHIQEAHILLLHTLAGIIENEFFG